MDISCLFMKLNKSISMKNIIITSIMLATIAACNPKEDNSIPLAEQGSSTVSAKGESQFKTAGEDILVQLISVEDSRCPLNANCVWMGSASLRFKISHKTVGTEVHVVFGAEKRISGIQEFNLDGQTYILTVTEVLPYPDTSKTPTLEDYEVKVKVEKK